MKRLLFFILISHILCAQEWTQTYGGIDSHFGFSVKQTIDGGYIIAGSVENSMGIDDVFLLKVDQSGDTLWSKKYGGAENDYGNVVRQTNDGGYVIFGHWRSFGSGGTDMFLIKTDENGNELWTKNFGGGDNEYGYSIEETNDGGFILCGATESIGLGEYDVYLIKTDINGNMIWDKTFGGVWDEKGYSVKQTTDGGYIITGKAESFDVNGFSDVYLIKTDANGNMIWEKTLGGSNTDDGYAVVQTIDGGYAICGNTYSFSNGSKDIYLLKTDENGNELWYKNFGGVEYDEGVSIEETTDLGFILVGATASFSQDAPKRDFYIIKTDNLGNEQSFETYGGAENDYCYSVQQTTDGGYIVCGSAYSFGLGESDIYLIKLASDLNIEVSDILSKNKQVIKKVDYLGRDISNKTGNQIIFYIYTDGTVDKIFKIDR